MSNITAKISLPNLLRRVAVFIPLFLGAAPLLFSQATSLASDSWQGAFSSETASPFRDVSATDKLFAPHILRMAENGFLQGKSANGVSTGEFQPDRAITRAELAKVTALVRLAEVEKDAPTMAKVRLPQVLQNHLIPYYRCKPGVCDRMSGKPFADVAEKADSCAEAISQAEICKDWFTQYVYFAVAKGFAKGYPPVPAGQRSLASDVAGGNWSFRPGDPVLRIHALKMLMAEDGNVSLSSDTRYKRLLTLADGERDGPRCLSDEAYSAILASAGGSKNTDSQKLLAYAKLADRLGLFGGTEFGGGCAVFGPTIVTPAQRTAFLFSPLTRKEAARYAALTTSYGPIMADRVTDPTLQGESVGLTEEKRPEPTQAPKTIDTSLPDSATSLATTSITAAAPKDPCPNCEKTTRPLTLCKENISSCTLPAGSSILYEGEVRIVGSGDNAEYAVVITVKIGGITKQYLVRCDEIKSKACVNAGWRESVKIVTKIPEQNPVQNIPASDAGRMAIPLASASNLGTTPLSKDDAAKATTVGNSDANNPAPVSQSWAEPINILTGNFWSEKTDLSIPIRGGVAEIKRTYNAQNPLQGSFGMGWSFDYDTRIEKNSTGDLVLTFGDGHSLYFESDGHGKFKPLAKATGTFLTKADALIYQEKDGTEYGFNKEGKLASIKDRNGNGPEFGLGADGTIQTVRDSLGTLFTLRRDEQGRITSAKDFGGRKTTYSYTKAGDLSKVCGPDRSACYRYAYDDKHRLLTIQNELGHTMIANKYDDRDRVTEQTDTMGGVSKLRYEKGKTWLTDPMGHGSLASDVMGNTKTQEYDANFQTTAETDPMGNAVRFEYDERGNLAKSTDALGHVTIYKYDDSGNRINETNSLGAMTTFAYNRAHQVTQVKSANGGITILKYGPDGNLTETIDPMGNKTVFTYDRFGRKTRQTDPNLATTLWIWNEDGTLLWTLDAVGRRTDYAYDNLRRPIRVTDSLGNATRIAYDSKGQVSETVNALGGKRKIGTDKAGNKTFETNENGATKRYSYDDKNRMVLETSASGNSITYEYDLNDHLARTTDSKGNKTSYEYDSAGRLVSVTNPLGETTKTEYDAAGKKTAIIDGNGNRTTFEYDVLGQLSKTTDAAGNATTFEHDVTGNLVKTTDALGNATVAEYDLAGRLISSTGPLGDKTKTEYDNMNRKTKFETRNSKLDDRNPLAFSFIPFDKLRAGKENPQTQVSKTEYDILGNPIRSINPEGAVTEYKYDALGRVTEEIDPNGNHSFTEYDALGNVAALTDALGHGSLASDVMGNITRFTYDKAGNRTGVTDALGNTTRYEYDRFGRLLSVTNALGGTTRNEYDPMGNIVRITDARGAKLEYEYDALGRMARGINGDGLVTAFEYDANGNRVKSTIKAGAEERTTSTEYDKLNRPLAVTNALGQTVRAEYDALGRKAKEISADGQVVQNEFDAAGRLVRTLDPMGNAQTNTYDTLGNLVAATDLNGNVRRFAYSPAGRLVSMTDAMGNTLKYAYDAAGNRVATIDPLGTKSAQKFDALGRLVSALDANGNGDIYEYDAVGNKVSQGKISADGKIFNKTVYAYDALRRLVSATDALGGTVRYEYDANSNRTSVIDQNGNVTKTEFDLMNRPVRTVDALGNSETWEYDKFGEMVAHTDKNGVTERLEYDGLGRVIKKEYASTGSASSKGGIVVAQEYDTAGRMTKLSDSNSLNCDYGDYADGPDCNVSNQNPQIISAEYDLRGFLTKVTDTKGRVTTYSYDKAGNVMSRKDPSGSVAYQYDSRNLAQRISWLPVGSKKATDYRFSFDPRGLLTQVAASHVDRDRTVTNDKSSVNYGFDPLGRLEKIEANDGKKAVWSAEYGYDDFGLKTSAMVTAIGSDPTIEEYAYDDAGRLVNWTKDGKAESYGYDLAYNRTGVTSGGKTVTYAYNGLNQLMSDGARTFAYDANGNLVSDGRQGYTWDALGRLTSVKTGDGSVDYSYDPLNRMAERVSGPDSLASDGAGGDRTTFAYPGLADKFVSQSDPGTETKYLYDMNGSPLANQTNGRPGLLVRNAHNDVVGGVNGGMSAYSPFGSTTTGISNTLGFQGQFSDPTTDLSQLGSRVYDPSTAQFLSPDPFPGLVSEPQGMNRYAYSHNDPVNFWDVSGAYAMDTHYGRTLEWARSIAHTSGIDIVIADRFARNIAAFDQYHDKEWSLVPNNYVTLDEGPQLLAPGDRAMESGQGNSLHFLNSHRDQLTYGNASTRAAIEANGYIDRLTEGNFLKNDESFGPKTVQDTIIPVFAMKSLSEFNSGELISNPEIIHGEKLAELTLKGKNIRERLEYAISEHDPRLFGIAMHEYQDSFAHAGFNKWHGMSHDNDIYCDSYESGPKCDPMDIVDQKNDGFPDRETNFVIQGRRDKREALYQRDQLMKDGTQYWLKKFFKEAATGFGPGPRKIRHNKLEDPEGTLKITEELTEDVFAKQGAGVGGAPCTDILKKLDITVECQNYYNENMNRITR